MNLKTCLLAASAAVLLAAAPARADWLFTPFVGANTGGDTVKTRTNWGISAAWMGAGAVGFEFDSSWTPNFFTSVEDDDPNNQLITNSRVSTYMFNAIVGAPVGGQSGKGVRPYGVIGLGAIKSRVESSLGLVDVQDTTLGWDLGAGVVGFVSNHVGLRGDVRYLGAAKNDLKDNPATADMGRFGFWRMTGGVTLRWAM